MSIVQTLKRSGKSIGAEIGQALGSVSERWDELLSHSGRAHTRLAREMQDLSANSSGSADFPRWSLIAGDQTYFLRIELPGMDKNECEVFLMGNSLCIRGEERLENGPSDSPSRVRERGYGSFRRTLSLSPNVDLASCSASLSEGVLTVCLPIQAESEQPRRIPVS